LRDAVEFEWAGKPSVAIIADALIGSAEAMKRISAMPEYEYAIVPYPVGTLKPDELRQRAREMTDRIIELLTAPVPRRPAG